MSKTNLFDSSTKIYSIYLFFGFHFLGEEGPSSPEFGTNSNIKWFQSPSTKIFISNKYFYIIIKFMTICLKDLVNTPILNISKK
jgi:hypothetical protein